jgi:hypothetical protein
MRKINQRFVEQTLEIWQPRTSKALNTEDVRQITENVAGFFQILLDWKAAEHQIGDQFEENNSRVDGHTAEGRRG